jgi:hypothetical protein
MTFYDKSIIYKLKHNEDYDDTNIYIGSTSNFKNRKYYHKNSCNNEKSHNYNCFVYKYIKDNGGWNEWVMIPIEEYPCNSKNELLIRERHYIDILRPTLNIKIPTRTDKEWRENNKEKIKEYFKQYHIDNKEKKIKKSKEYYDNNKEKLKEYKKEYQKIKVICDHCGCEVCKKGLNAHKKTNNCINVVKKETKIEEKAICDHCGCEVLKQGLNRHQKTKKCINFVKS